MSLATNRLLLRLGRWPRRCAASACLILAISSTMADSRTVRAKPGTLAEKLHPGQVAVPIPLSQPLSADFVVPGERVGLLTGDSDGSGQSNVGTVSPTTSPRLVADRLRVLSIHAGSDDGATAVIIVATDRATATRIAGVLGSGLLAVLDNSP